MNSMLLDVRSRLESIGGGVLDGCILVADDGAAGILECLGGMGYLGSLGVSTVMDMGDEDLAGNIMRWDKSSKPEFVSGQAKDSSKPLRLVFLVTDYIWGREEWFGSVLSSSFTTEWIVCRILCTISAKAHACAEGRSPIDFTDFCLKVQGLSRPNAAEVRAEGFACNVCVLVDDSDAGDPGLFVLPPNKHSKRLFPFTISRLGLTSLKKDVGEIDGNDDLSASSKSDIKLTASMLESILREQFQVDVSKSCWAVGFTSRLIGHAILDHYEDYEAQQLQLGNRESKELKQATLLLVDRSADLVSGLFEGESPLAQHVLGQVSVESKFEFQSTLGVLSMRHASDRESNDLLRFMCMKSTEQTLRKLGDTLGPVKTSKDLGRILEKSALEDRAFLHRIPFYQTVANASLALEAMTHKQQMFSLERIIVNNPDRSHILLPLVDLLNRQVTSVDDILKLATIAFALLGNLSSEFTPDKDMVESLSHALTQAVENTHKGVYDSAHVIDVLKESMTSSQNTNRSLENGCWMGFIASVILCALSGEPSPATQLGESVFEKTASDIGKTASKFLKQSFNVFGFGRNQEEHCDVAEDTTSTPKSDEQHRMRLNDGDTCIIFVTGGISYFEISQVLQVVSEQNTNIRFLFGGTSIADPEQVILHSLESISCGPKTLQRRNCSDGGGGSRETPQESFPTLYRT
uniref:Sec1 family domain-containing protein 2 n=1 Tax=Mucochytrium quahogii TaxID=96639 RepID=A0A7S2RQS3_9STRA|mmetsp:Transcript_13767/g.22463  ORF Transcript_13767/g.22463 Transcript_13767/m.22463 type:complete len:692 (+) Transcript_13767:105-2180(+)